jgi:S1-C subfamily serine protease
VSARRLVTIVLASAMLAGCGDEPRESTDPAADGVRQPAAAPVDRVLVVKGQHVERSEREAAQGRAAAPVDAEPPRQRERRPSERPRIPPLPLLADGSIDAGPDPFEASFVPVQAIPIEDGPDATRTIARSAAQLRRIDRARWDEWMRTGIRSPWQQGDDPISASLVEVTVERCGGARHVATGVVLADETVVTNVHVVENAAKRVRVSQAVGMNPRLPAMIRYLDVDDDVAVLRVPGLRAPALAMYRPAGAAPRFGYAFGIAPGGRSGMLRRVPVVTTTREETITVEQPDGFAQPIRDRSVQTLVGGISSGFSGGVVATTNTRSLAGGWGFHGLLRARASLRADTAGIVVPSRIVAAALAAERQLEEWFEHRPGGCPQWRR